MRLSEKQSPSAESSRAQANQPSSKGISLPAVYGSTTQLMQRQAKQPTSSLQLKKGVMQMVWYERVGGNIVEKDDPRPKNKHNPTNGVMYKGAKVTVWEPKIPAPVLLSYKQKLGNVPTVGEFTIPSNLVRFSQNSIASTFTSGAGIESTITALKNKTLDPSTLPAIRVIWSKTDSAHKEARLVTLDNRRLYCCQQAGVNVKCVLVDWDNYPEEDKKREIKKFTSGQGRDGSATIEVR